MQDSIAGKASEFMNQLLTHKVENTEPVQLESYLPELEHLKHIKINCVKCGSSEVIRILQQTRSLDEITSELYCCQHCGYRKKVN